MIGAMSSTSATGALSGSPLLLDGQDSTGHYRASKYSFRPPLMANKNNDANKKYYFGRGREGCHHRCGRCFLEQRCIFHLTVITPLIGLILIFIGLVQLVSQRGDGDEGSGGLPMIVAGTVFTTIGVLLYLTRTYFTYILDKLEESQEVPRIIVVNTSSSGGTTTDKNNRQQGNGSNKIMMTTFKNQSNPPNPPPSSPPPEKPPRHHHPHHDHNSPHSQEEKR